MDIVRKIYDGCEDYDLLLRFYEKFYIGANVQFIFCIYYPRTRKSITVPFAEERMKCALVLFVPAAGTITESNSLCM